MRTTMHVINMQVFTVKDQLSQKYIVPLNSACKFGLYYQKGTCYFDTVEDVMKVCTKHNYRSIVKGNNNDRHTCTVSMLVFELAYTYTICIFHLNCTHKQASPLPRVIAAQCSHPSGNDTTSVSRLEILAVKGVNKVWAMIICMQQICLLSLG